MHWLLSISLLVFLCHALDSIQGAKILAVYTFPGPSQYILVQPYLKALARRGHEVTVISGFPQKEKIKNFRDIPVLEMHENYDDLLKEGITKQNKWAELNLYVNFSTDMSIKTLKNPEVQKLLKSNEKFDLVIVEPLMNEVIFGFGEHFNASIIAISSFGTNPYVDELVGNTSPVSYVPLVSTDLTDRMNFWQRLKNLAMVTIETVHYHTVVLPHNVKLYKQYFPNAKIDLMELRKTIALVLVNQHFSLSFPRPYVPNMIEVGGFHLNNKSSPLPQDMEAFINSSKNGVIYFSLGSNIKSKDLPKDVISKIILTLASLPYNVMWKFEDTNLPDKPKNVYINKWFPQPDILSHPKVKLFITHGGLLSTIEAIWHGKPIVGIPFFFDQFLNVERVKDAGFGVSVDLPTLTVDGFRAKIVEVLNNPSYTEIAKKISKRFHDQPINPLEKAIYWTEYVLRHKGAPHMRVSALNLNFMQYHSLDTLSFLFGGLSLVVLVVGFLMYKLIVKLRIVLKNNSNDFKEKKLL